MINKIKTHEILSQYVEESCCENGICVTFDDEISPDSYVILKVDKYYNSLNIELRPASVDCLIIRKCIKTGYGITLVELKNIDNSNTLTSKNIKEKFETTLFDFIKTVFRENLDVYYSDIKLLFVSNINLHRRDLGLAMETLMNTQLKFNDKKLMISFRMPNPTIKNCYS